MKIGLYGRVSTTDKGQDVEMQLRDLRAYAQARGWVVFDEYLDLGESGAKDSRPELNRLLQDARKRRIDGILVWRLDRFGRSLKHLINTLDELKALGINFISYSESLDFTTSTGQLLFHLLGAFAEFERNIIKERVRAGINHARQKGIKLGRPSLITGGICERMQGLRDKGYSIRQIAKEVNISPSLVHKTLTNLKSIDIGESTVYRMA